MIMPDKPENPPISEPPRRTKVMKVDNRMRDPFTDQPTQPAGDGQGANKPQSGPGGRDDNDDEETMPVEEGFSPIP
jgi:hypothetical protein